MRTTAQIEADIAATDAAMRDLWKTGATGPAIHGAMAKRFELENELIDAQDAEREAPLLVKFDWRWHLPLAVLGLLAAWMVLA